MSKSVPLIDVLEIVSTFLRLPGVEIAPDSTAKTLLDVVDTLGRLKSRGLDLSPLRSIELPIESVEDEDGVDFDEILKEAEKEQHDESSIDSQVATDPDDGDETIDDIVRDIESEASNVPPDHHLDNSSNDDEDIEEVASQIEDELDQNQDDQEEIEHGGTSTADGCDDLGKDLADHLKRLQDAISL